MCTTFAVLIALVLALSTGAGVTVLAWRTGIYSHKSFRWYIDHICLGRCDDGNDCHY